MTKFEILVSRGNLQVSNSTMEIEAATQEEAEKKALELAPYKDDWKDSGDIDYNYQVEDVDEVPEIYPYYCDCHKEGFESMEEMAAHEKEIGAIGDES